MSAPSTRARPARASSCSTRWEHRLVRPERTRADLSQPGYVEHDPLEIWRNTQEVIGRPSKKGLSPRDLAAIGITNQRETTLIWDKRTGKPLHNALVWQDTRVDALVEEFAQDGGYDRLRTKTGLPLASYFSGLKLRWLLDTCPVPARRRLPAMCCSAISIPGWSGT